MSFLHLAGVPREPLMAQPVRVQDGETKNWAETAVFQNLNNYRNLYDAICKILGGELLFNDPKTTSTFSPTTDYNLVTKKYVMDTVVPLTTKGDILGFSTVRARVPIGTDTYILTADSAQALGLKWAAHFDATLPAALGTAAAGTAATAARRDHVHTMPTLDGVAAPTDVTTLNASTSAHGLVVKATAPAANTLNVVGIANGETAYTCKTLFDATNPEALGTAAPGTSLYAAHRDHVHASQLAIFAGGNTGDVLTKNSGADYDFSWIAPSTMPASTTTGDMLINPDGSGWAVLSVGTPGDVLIVSGGNVPTWASQAPDALHADDADTATSASSADHASDLVGTYTGTPGTPAGYVTVSIGGTSYKLEVVT